LRIHVLSDLHLEFRDFALPTVDADVRVLAGDIHTKERGVPFAIRHSGDMPTLYVAGNHEFYGTAIPKLYDKLKAMTIGSAVTVLENDQRIIGDVRFLGCTLWTDFGLLGADTRSIAMLEAKMTMTDYKKIRMNPSYRKLTPAATYDFHRRSLNWLESRLAEPFFGKTVVITHHAPSALSIADNSELIAASYGSSLEDLIRANPIHLWIHGHTHNCVDYTIGETRIVSNQRGYPGEQTGNFDPNFVVTL
jgi:predicted phosphodiesterase